MSTKAVVGRRGGGGLGRETERSLAARDVSIATIRFIERVALPSAESAVAGYERCIELDLRGQDSTVEWRATEESIDRVDEMFHQLRARLTEELSVIEAPNSPELVEAMRDAAAVSGATSDEESWWERSKQDAKDTALKYAGSFIPFGTFAETAFESLREDERAEQEAERAEAAAERRGDLAQARAARKVKYRSRLAKVLLGFASAEAVSFAGLALLHPDAPTLVPGWTISHLGMAVQAGSFFGALGWRTLKPPVRAALEKSSGQLKARIAPLIQRVRRTGMSEHDRKMLADPGYRAAFERELARQRQMRGLTAPPVPA